MRPARRLFRWRTPTLPGGSPDAPHEAFVVLRADHLAITEQNGSIRTGKVLSMFTSGRLSYRFRRKFRPESDDFRSVRPEIIRLRIKEVEHDVVRKPLDTFRHHALAAGTAIQAKVSNAEGRSP